MTYASAAVAYRSDQCFLPLGTGDCESCMPPDRRFGAIHGVPDVQIVGGARRALKSGP